MFLFTLSHFLSLTHILGDIRPSAPLNHNVFSGIITFTNAPWLCVFVIGAYVILDTVLFADDIYTNTLGLCVFAAALCLLRPLSFSVTVASLKATLCRLSGSAFDFTLIYFILLMAFGHTMVIGFAHEVEYMRDLGHALYTEAGLSLLGFSRSVSGNVVSTKARGGLMLLFSIMTQIIVMNLFISVIVVTVTEVKNDISKRQEERELSEHLWGKMRKWLGITEGTKEGVTDSERGAEAEGTKEGVTNSESGTEAQGSQGKL